MGQSFAIVVWRDYIHVRYLGDWLAFVKHLCDDSPFCIHHLLSFLLCWCFFFPASKGFIGANLFFGSAVLRVERGMGKGSFLPFWDYQSGEVNEGHLRLGYRVHFDT